MVCRYADDLVVMCESEPEAETTLLATGDGRPREAAGMRAGPTALLGYRASSLPYHYRRQSGFRAAGVENPPRILAYYGTKGRWR